MIPLHIINIGYLEASITCVFVWYVVRTGFSELDKAFKGLPIKTPLIVFILRLTHCLKNFLSFFPAAWGLIHLKYWQIVHKLNDKIKITDCLDCSECEL